MSRTLPAHVPYDSGPHVLWGNGFTSAPPASLCVRCIVQGTVTPFPPAPPPPSRSRAPAPALCPLRRMVDGFDSQEEHPDLTMSLTESADQAVPPAALCTRLSLRAVLCGSVGPKGARGWGAPAEQTCH